MKCSAFQTKSFIKDKKINAWIVDLATRNKIEKSQKIRTGAMAKTKYICTEKMSYEPPNIKEKEKLLQGPQFYTMPFSAKRKTMTTENKAEKDLSCISSKISLTTLHTTVSAPTWPLKNRWVHIYLSTVIEGRENPVTSYELSCSNDKSLVMKTLNVSPLNNPAPGIVHCEHILKRHEST